MASVDINKVIKTFGSTQILHSVEVDINDQEFVVLVGPSGCGKSTLLRMIAGLESIDGGEISIGQRVVNKIPPKERDTAMVFQNYALYPHMKVYDNMAFSLKLKKIDPNKIDQLVKEAAEILGLSKKLERYPRQLSGGERQRVAMGRAIVRHPQVFLFDEPLSNLDAKLRVQMRTEIKSLHQRLNATSIYVTHDQIEAMTMADRIVIMNAGRIEQIGAPLELYDTPANTFVASFIGSPAMNLIKGSYKKKQDKSFVVTDSGAHLLAPNNLGLVDNQKVTYGIRPDHFIIKKSDQSFVADVDVSEPTGTDTIIFLNLGQDYLCTSFKERHSFQLGEKVHLLPDVKKVHIFDEQGSRISLR